MKGTDHTENGISEVTFMVHTKIEGMTQDDQKHGQGFQFIDVG